MSTSKAEKSFTGEMEVAEAAQYWQSFDETFGGDAGARSDAEDDDIQAHDYDAWADRADAQGFDDGADADAAPNDDVNGPVATAQNGCSSAKSKNESWALEDWGGDVNEEEEDGVSWPQGVGHKRRSSDAVAVAKGKGKQGGGKTVAQQAKRAKCNGNDVAGAAASKKNSSDSSSSSSSSSTSSDDVKPTPAGAKASTPAQVQEPVSIDDWVAAQQRLFGHMPALPSGWIRMMSKSRKNVIYFYNVKTGESRGEAPTV